MTEATAAASLNASIGAGSVAGTTKFTASAGAGNTLAYKLTAATQTAYQDGYPGLLTAYTSGDNITASVGQYLGMYELNAYGRVVKFAVEALEAGDFPL